MKKIMCFLLISGSTIACSDKWYRDENAGLLQTVTQMKDNTSVSFQVTDKQVMAKEDKTYSWYHKGKMQSSQAAYMGRLLDGPYHEIDQEKKPVVVGMYRKGLKHNKWLYYDDGALRESMEYCKGERHGLQKAYKDGQLHEQIRYKAGQQHGPSLTFDEEIIRMIKYRKDEPVDTSFVERLPLLLRLGL
ncbi:MAG: hypothetical protein AAF789_07930 [Bacteroidota bacterium]